MGVFGYLAILEPEGKGFCISFPDWDAFTCGDDLDDALYMAKDCLEGLIEWKKEDGEKLPQPTQIKDVKIIGKETVHFIPLKK